MAFTKSRVHSAIRRSVSLPDMTPFAGLIFLIVCFYAITTRFKTPQIGNVALEELPYCSGSGGCMADNTDAVIGLDDDGHYSFSVSSPLFQTTTIQTVAAAQSITFSALQLSKLNHLEYLDTNIRALPAILERQSNKQSSSIRKHYPLGEKQLLACLITSKSVVQALAHKPSYVALLINSKTSSSKVMHLIDLLQTRGINRYNLKLQDEPQYVSKY